MREHVFPAIKLTILMLVLFLGIYTIAVWGVARLAPNKGKGELVIQDGRSWYANIGQSFTDDRYFYSRPSAVNYNAAGSGGSNKGPSNPDHLKLIQARIDTFLLHNPGISRSQVPVELVTASGSGLDPHISPKAAAVQVKRIAGIRNISESTLNQLVLQNTEGPSLGLFGPPTINVLKLNLELDELTNTIE